MSKPRKILFDHLPKCGGRSLNAYLDLHYSKRKTFSVYDSEAIDKFKNLSRFKRYKYDLVRGHLARRLLDYVHPESLKVTILRDPVDRVVSHYYYVKRSPSHYLYPQVVELNLDEYVQRNLGGELRNFYTVYFSGLPLRDAEQNPEESVAMAAEALSRYDAVGFLDDFASFAAALRRRAELKRPYRNKKLNATPNRPGIDEIEPAIISRIKQANHLDIALYEKIRDL